ncbi:Phenylalanine-tRNA ligase, alpha subunit [Paramicrosporidium saccamoebae]|uniref:phenylalanine--tRNA ligase n=1 Tax=Paramicrosporidium saccamoebae TaxID=1246581 RepID=A0A2H9TNG8_9FUNG|nr:Phenylalanine-tRNA ligase, alpha subunit [Paramicrosporidium saccamoebae]
MSNDTIQNLILVSLDRDGKIENTSDLRVDGKPVDQQLVLGVLKRLDTHEMVKYETLEKEEWLLTDEGLEIAEKGSHEAVVFALVPAGSDGTSVAAIQDSATVIRLVDSIEDLTCTELQLVRDGKALKEDTLKELKKRKLVDKSKRMWFSVIKGPAFALSLHKLATDLTHEVVQSKAWQTMQFKEYNFNAVGQPTQGGHLHPLLKVREEFRHVFLEMGFTEMPTNRFVESSFWNFDTLFQPQQHPSRDAHDTFFLKSPASCNTIPADYLQRTKEIHEVGGFGSLGHRCEWAEVEAKKNILRTHTTAISSQMLYKLAQQPKFKPSKYFSIDRVFRNETLDATHLAEFHQIEGLVADYNLTLGDLIGMLKEFFKKMGMTKLRFKPAFNPYTEPSMEVFAYHDGLAKWIEVGNSGVFRPEMLGPMGLDENVTVIAWGLSLERPTMIKYGVSNIRNLFGHKVDLAQVQSNPACRLDKL